MPLQKHIINYPKRQIHYRSGVYPCRRVTYQPRGEPQLSVRRIVGPVTLQRILTHEGLSPNEDVKVAANDLADVVTLFVEDVLFLSPGEVIRDVLNGKYGMEFEITHVS